MRVVRLRVAAGPFLLAPMVIASCSSSGDGNVLYVGRGDEAAVPMPARDGGSAPAQDATVMDGGVLADATVDATTADALVPVDAPLDGAHDASDGPPVADASADAARDAQPDAAFDASPLDCSTDAGHAVVLGCTGLYSNWAARTVAPDVLPYDPGLHFWSDGTLKRRWIRLPPGTQIDTTAMDEWNFPIGTKFWKEFTLGGLKVETRLLEKLPDGSWFRTTYRWSPDQQSAPELTVGETNVNGTTYEIPDQGTCSSCHMGRIDGILGFEAVSLAQAGASGVTLAELVAQNKLTSPPAMSLAIPGNATEQAALGWLHANCGTACHSNSPSALAGRTGLRMRLEAAQLNSVQSTDTWTTAVNVPSQFQPTPNAGLQRIAPRDVPRSAITYRAGRRDAVGAPVIVQMPPFVTHVVDDAGVQAVSAWINIIP